METADLHRKMVIMECFFRKQSKQIKQKCTIRVIRNIRMLGKESPEAKLLDDGDDTYAHLDMFEQISLVAMEGYLDYYPHAQDTIYNFAKLEYENLTDDDKFILNHQGLGNDYKPYCAIEDIESHFVQYATDYTNKKLSKYRQTQTALMHPY